MPPREETFSKIVRSLLLDVDVHLDQLEQIGYLSKEQRAFVDKFLYKSEDALQAVNLVQDSGAGCRSEVLLPEAASPDDYIPRVEISSPSKSTNYLCNATTQSLSRLRSVTEQLKSEENGLSTFLKRCNARNFSVQVKGTEMAKEVITTVKGSEYISNLEPIEEGAVTENINNAEVKLDDNKFSGNSNHDTNMMRHGATSPSIDTDAESIEFENSLQTDTIDKLNAFDIGHKIPEAITLHPEKDGTYSTKPVEFIAAIYEPYGVQAAVVPTQIDHGSTAQINPGQPKNLTDNKGAIEMELGDLDSNNKSEQIADSGLWGDDTVPQSPVIDPESEPETNAWGKPLRPDPTRNKEGAIVGASAKPLGLENKGRAMMEKMGWSKGTGLGKQNSGILVPILHVVKNTKAGLRSSDEKKCKSPLNPPSEEKLPTSLPDPVIQETDVDADAILWEAGPHDPDWDKPAKLTNEKGDNDTMQGSTEKIVKELDKIMARVSTVKSPLIGIKAMYLGGGDSPDLERTVNFNTKIRSTNEHKITMHPPGIIIRALSSQGSKYMRDANYNVGFGSKLEVLRVHQGDEYHVYNFRTKKRGIIKIALLEMMEEPKMMQAGATPFSATSAAVATWI